MKWIQYQLVVALMIAVGAGLFTGQGALAEGQPSTGFTVNHVVVVGLPADQVYRSLVSQVDQWWHPAHTYTGDSRNLSIDARPGGCFCEQFPDGGGVEHMRVVYVAPDRSIRLSGGLGPLQLSGVAGSMIWTLAESDDSTTVAVRYVVGGFVEGGFEGIAPAVDRVVGEQLQRLKHFVETGSPAAEPE